MGDLGYLLVDADSHYYEPDDCFSRHIESSFRDQTVWVDRGSQGLGRVFLGEDRLRFFTYSPCDATGRPGALLEYFRSKGGSGSALTTGGMISAADIPESTDRAARLAWLEEQGVEATMLFPTLGVGVEYQLSKDPAVLCANLTSFNRWLEEDWGYGSDGRLFGVPLLSLIDLNWAVGELERVIERGARAVHLKPGPVGGEFSPADPRFDPFWARCQEAGIFVAFHIGNCGYTDQFSSRWSEVPEPAHHRLSPFQRVTSFMERPISDTMCALVTHNLFGRFPSLTVASIEHGAEWVEPLLRKMDRAARVCGDRDWPFGGGVGRPSEVFKQHVKVAPFPEEDVTRVAAVLGAANVLGGSDWPHPEGSVDAMGLVDSMGKDLDPVSRRLILRENTARLLGME